MLAVTQRFECGDVVIGTCRVAWDDLEVFDLFEVPPPGRWPHELLAEGFGDQFAALHQLDGLAEVLRQRLDAHRAALGVGERPDVVVGAGRELVALLDALEARGQHHREREVRVARGVG